MVKLSILIKGIVLYIFFILGISMVSEWWENNRNKRNCNGNLDEQINIYLESIKNEIIQKFGKEKFVGDHELTETSQINLMPPTIPPQILSEEDKIIKAVNDRLMYSNYSNGNGNYNGNDNNVYSNLCNNGSNLQLASASDFNYMPISKMEYNNQQQYIPKYTRYPIENSMYSYN